MKIHLITNCTNLKKTHIKGKVSLESLVKKKPHNTIVNDWYKRLLGAEQKLPATEVYAGDHWKVATSIINKEIDLWVLSAGYGLIHSSSNIASYDATFSSESDNSIKKTGLSNIEWWNKLHQIRDSDNFKCQSLQSLVSINTDDVFVIAASPDYLKVIQDELKTLISDKKLTLKNLFIISSKHNINNLLTPYFLESSADFCSTLKGGRVSLNIRLAKYLLGQSNNKFNPDELRKKYQLLKTSSEKVLVKKRQKLSDDEVNSFIKSEIKNHQGANISATVFLKKLRSKGLACEQKRFSKLLKQIKLGKSITTTQTI